MSSLKPAKVIATLENAGFQTGTYFTSAITSRVADLKLLKLTDHSAETVNKIVNNYVEYRGSILMTFYSKSAWLTGSDETQLRLKAS